jgi:predicted HNH restriction endonuclease
MNPGDAHLRERAEKAARIIAEPGNYKVCEGCESIVTRRVTTCPNCHGYRFDDEAASVVEQARLLASRPQRTVIDRDLSS